MKLQMFLFLIALFFAMAASLLSLATVVPEAEEARSLTVLAGFGAAALTAVLAFLLRFVPDDHPLRIKKLPLVFTAALAAFGLLLLLVSAG